MWFYIVQWQHHFSKCAFWTVIFDKNFLLSDWVATDSELTSAGNGASCWCGVTKYSPVSGTQCIKTSINWGFHFTYTSYSQCSKDCSYSCANDIEGKAKFRAALYGITK